MRRFTLRRLVGAALLFSLDSVVDAADPVPTSSNTNTKSPGQTLSESIFASNATTRQELAKEIYLNRHSAQRLHSSSFSTQDLPVGTCNEQTPCVNGACCSRKTGLCGYSPAECGADCASNCDAKAECGQYGRPGKQQCPLGVCCSEFGFCGSTTEFCDKGCQKDFGGCGDVKRPSCSKNGGSTDGLSVGYYESWANTRKCQSVAPEDLNLRGFTHINFAFVFFHPQTFEIVPMDKNAGELLSRFTKLKEKKPGLQVYVSVGGWSFNDPGPYQKAFSDMASTAANRKKFIDGLIKFMDTYGFDGADLDWEYPSADDRGGRPEDTANFVKLSEDIKAAFGGSYGYTITLPASYWYLQHFQVAKHQESVNWFNIMSYDIHGVWDGASKAIGPKIAPHTNITELDLGLDLLWRAGVKPDKVVLGQGYYGRSFTLSDPLCNKPNGVCQFSGGANEGRCSGASGVLTLQEIKEIVKDKNLKPVHDQEAAVKWITWDSNQWVSYDDEDTFPQKREFANSRCLGGLMVWAMDQVDQKAKSLVFPDELSDEEIQDAETIYQDEAAQGVCYTTKCNDKCDTGDHEASQMNGQPGQLSTMERCEKGQFRRLCCLKGSTMGTCRWRGYRGLGLSCTGGCGEDETEITQNTNHHSDTEDQSCSGGTQSYCCKGFKPPISKKQVQDKIEDKAKDVALEIAEAAALELAATAFCRVAITALLMPLSFIPIVGWIIRLAVQAAVPALSKLCAKGIAKGGKSVFKFKGKTYDVKLDKPLKPKNDRKPSAEPSKPPSRTQNCKVPGNNQRLQKRALRPITMTKTVTRGQEDDAVTRTCNYIRGGQACLHYSSVINRRPKLQRLTCAPKRGVGNGDIREVRNNWSSNHHTAWINGWMQKANLNCQRDEFPPAEVWQARDKNVWIRLLPGKENGSAGQLFKGCPARVRVRRVSLGTGRQEKMGCRNYVIFTETVKVIDKVIDLQFSNMPNLADAGLTDNPCWPETLVDDAGFALNFNDPWYARKANENRRQYTAYYPAPPGPQFTQGKVNQPGWNKRAAAGAGGAGMWEPDDMYVDQGNSSRRATDDELREDFGLVRCAGDCSREMADLGYASLPVARSIPTAGPASVVAEATPTLTDGVTMATTLSRVVKAAASTVTAAAEALITDMAEYGSLGDDGRPEESDLVIW